MTDKNCEDLKVITEICVSCLPGFSNVKGIVQNVSMNTDCKICPLKYNYSSGCYNCIAGSRTGC